MDIFAEIAKKIITEQETIIGPIAIEQANKVPGLSVEPKTHTVTFSGDETNTINLLVEQYRNFFGQASVEVCKEAVKNTMSRVPQDKIPSLLL